MNIGVFDSGLGGLTILKKLIKKLPQYNFVYYGDNARVPYGNRSREIIYQFTKEAVDFLIKKNCLLIIIACNTASATSLKKIQQEFLPVSYPDIKVLGVIKPAVEEIQKGNFNRVGVIGTRATINSEAYIHEIKKIKSGIKIFQKACPLFVPFIEDIRRNKEILKLLLKDYLTSLKKKNIDSLLLACTHYEIIEKEIKNFFGKQTKIITEGKVVAEKLKDYLVRHPEIEEKLDKQSQVEYHFTDSNSDYKRLMKLFFYD